MASTKLFDAVVKTGEYQSNGETKGRYENVGSIMQGDNGMFMILKRTFNAAGVPNPDNKDSVIVSFFESQQQGQQNNQSQQQNNNQGQQQQGYQGQGQQQHGQQNSQQQNGYQQQNGGYQGQ